ncbi:MAG: hypothetical protein ACQEP8_00515 [Chlamydiota bacterium]
MQKQQALSKYTGSPENNLQNLLGLYRSLQVREKKAPMVKSSIDALKEQALETITIGMGKALQAPFQTGNKQYIHLKKGGLFLGGRKGKASYKQVLQHVGSLMNQLEGLNVEQKKRLAQPLQQLKDRNFTKKVGPRWNFIGKIIQRYNQHITNRFLRRQGLYNFVSAIETIKDIQPQKILPTIIAAQKNLSQSPPNREFLEIIQSLLSDKFKELNIDQVAIENLYHSTQILIQLPEISSEELPENLKVLKKDATEKINTALQSGNIKDISQILVQLSQVPQQELPENLRKLEESTRQALLNNLRAKLESYKKPLNGDSQEKFNAVLGRQKDIAETFSALSELMPLLKHDKEFKTLLKGLSDSLKQVSSEVLQYEVVIDFDDSSYGFNIDGNEFGENITKDFTRADYEIESSGGEGTISILAKDQTRGQASDRIQTIYSLISKRLPQDLPEEQRSKALHAAIILLTQMSGNWTIGVAESNFLGYNPHFAPLGASTVTSPIKVSISDEGVIHIEREGRRSYIDTNNEKPVGTLNLRAKISLDPKKINTGRGDYDIQEAVVVEMPEFATEASSNALPAT